MNISKELKKKRDAEARLNKQSPEPTFSSNGTTETYIDISGLALKSELKDEIVELNDVDITLTGNAGKVLKVNATGTGIDLGTGGGADDFLDLTDTPSTYTGEGGKIVAVKATADGLEFVSAPAATNGIPTGGTAGQIIEKVDGTDYNVQWTDVPAASNGLPTGGTANQILSKIDGTNYNTQWVDAPSGGGGGYLNPIDEPPSSPSIWDDEFEGTSLDVKWSWVNQGTATSDVSNGDLMLTMPTGSDASRGIIQSAPSGDFTATAKISLEASIANYLAFGLAIFNSSNNRIMQIGRRNANGSCGMWWNKATPTTWNGELVLSGYGGGYVYVKIQVASGVLTLLYSHTGARWITILTENVSTFIGAITGIGLFAFRNNNTAADVHYCVCDWFRVVE